MLRNLKERKKQGHGFTTEQPGQKKSEISFEASPTQYVQEHETSIQGQHIVQAWGTKKKREHIFLIIVMILVREYEEVPIHSAM